MIAEVLLNVLFASIFVGTLYLTPAHIRRLTHNNPVQIKQRAKSTVLSCVVCGLLVYAWCHHLNPSSLSTLPTHHLLGLRTTGFVPALVLPLLLTMVLFSGALVCKFFEHIIFQAIDQQHQQLSHRHNLKYGNGDGATTATTPSNGCPTPRGIVAAVVLYLSNWPNVRTVLIAPVCEEFVFRSCMAAILLHAKTWTSGQITVVLPLFFGIAHGHHFYRLVSLEKKAVKQALVQCVFQFTYTTLFGIYATFIYLRTGHLVAAIACHCFCNWNGFPDLGWLLDKQDLTRTYKREIAVSYVVGIVLFCYGLYPVTNPEWYGSQLW